MPKTYNAIAYGPRYGDPIGVMVTLRRANEDSRISFDKALLAAEKAAQFERDELPGYCEDSCGDCSFCCPDVLTWEGYHAAKYLFTPAELREHRRALVAGEVVVLYR
jgi:hypothetical protein